MYKWRCFGIRPLTLALVASFAVACTADPPEGAGAVSPADAQLAAFGREHPRCQLWTNWQKMCSRTGLGGEPYCVVDPARPANPSRSFCVYSGEGAELPVLGGEASQSVARFCRRSGVHGIYRGAETDPDERINYCAEFEADRPFNGRSLAGRRHPWCRQWNDTHTEGPVCTEDGGDGLPDCGTLATADYRHTRPLYCSRFEPPPWCDEAEGMLDRVALPPGAVAVRDVRYQDSDFLPVHGVVCRKRRIDE